MKWQPLISTQNLKLAWRRINTGKNLQYKRFFREAYLVYESTADENIRDLHRELEARAWRPTHATRIYLPKPSGLQRPLSLLAIEDQIVLQAVANQFAARLRKRRKLVELNTVFSNILPSEARSIFFVQPWQTGYAAFQERCVNAYQSGMKWAAHFDLSAYYDTISHNLLQSIVRRPSDEVDVLETISEWLRVWSADNIGAMTAHGIPQGPVASDFLAEAFFVPIDIQLQNAPFLYLRYVDDIRLFGRTENEVREGAIRLEQECRHRGLIPQSSKFDIRRIESVDDAMGSLPSIVPNAADDNPKIMSAREARFILASAIGGRPQKVVDKSRFRYVMYRAPADGRLLDSVIRLLPRHPEHIDAFLAYFANYRKRTRIARAALDYLENGVPYSYVRGELWHVIARLGSVDDLQRGLPLAREDARKRGACVAWSWGGMHFFAACEKAGLARDGRRIRKEAPISRSLLAPILPGREFTPDGVVVDLLKGTVMEQLAAARELQRRSIKIGSLGLRQRDLSPLCNRTLKSFGVIRRQHRGAPRDWVGEVLANLYRCRRSTAWRMLLDIEYEHAHQCLVEASSRFSGAYSEWLALQDSFSDIVIRRFFEFLRQKAMPGHSTTVDSRGNLVKYGSLIARNSPFDRVYPAVADALRAVHVRRNQLPGSHPYDEKGGSRNRWLKVAERNALLPRIRVALETIAVVVEANP